MSKIVKHRKNLAIFQDENEKYALFLRVRKTGETIYWQKISTDYNRYGFVLKLFNKLLKVYNT